MSPRVDGRTTIVVLQSKVGGGGKKDWGQNGKRKVEKEPKKEKEQSGYKKHPPHN